jgi:hypothetical protein
MTLCPLLLAGRHEARAPDRDRSIPSHRAQFRHAQDFSLTD